MSQWTEESVKTKMYEWHRRLMDNAEEEVVANVEDEFKELFADNDFREIGMKLVKSGWKA